MQEQLISFEVAKLAKGKGFCVPTWDYFEEDSQIEECDLERKNWNVGLNTHKNISTISRPTQSLLQKWLREVHNIDILVTTINGRRLERYVSKIYINKLYKKLVGHSVIYEDTFEKGLQEALKLIK